MEQAKAQLNYLRVAPRKVRLLADVIRGLPIQEAEAKLMLNPRRPKDALLKLLRSATANAKNNGKLNMEKLFIKEIRVDQGPKTGHWTPRSRGSMSLIEKKTSHVTIILGVNDKIKPRRFNIEIKKPVKAEKAKKSKREKNKEIAEEKPEAKPAAKPGAFKRIFSRKAI
jgi:large subunit ribosomal protein L22